MISKKIIAALTKVAEGTEFTLERPVNEAFGEYASNLALVLGKNKGKNPRELAGEIVEKIRTDPDLMDLVDKIEVEGPGFINFRLKANYFLNLIAHICNDGAFGLGDWGAGKRVLIEYSSPNIAKRFGAGHLRSTIIGDALAKLYKFSGWEVVTDNHLGDWGTQFGMIIAAVEEKNLDITKMTVAQLEDLYVEFNQQIEANPTLKDKAREAFARLEAGDESARKIWQAAKEVSLKEFQGIYDRLGVKFDFQYGEADYEQEMKEIIPEIKSKIGRESQGAQIVEFADLPPAMLVKSNGTTTYFTRDMATVKFRQDNEELKSDLNVYEVGAEQILHFRQVFAAAELMGWGRKEQFKHVAHGQMSLPEGKMSTRKGRTVKLEELLSKAKEMAIATFYQKHLPSTKQGVANLGIPEGIENIAMGAIKFNELRHAPTSNYVFRWDEALNMEGESGPYLQYALVRAINVLKDQDLLPTPQKYEFNEEESRLVRWLDRFPDVVESAAREFGPHLLCNYLFELAQRFNSFYNQHRILQADTKEQQALRLSLTENFACVMRTGLSLLGINSVTEM